MPTRIHRSLVAALALLVVGLAGCGSGEGGGGDGGAAAGGAAKVEAGAFPVTVAHKYGSTTIERAPRRIAVVGLREQDSLLALGVVPVATTEWYGKHPGAIFPWAKDELGSSPVPTVLSDKDGVQIEKVAATRPDLILAVYSGLRKGDYAALSRIAPVDFGSSWQQETRITGQAVGQPARAEELVKQTERLVADQASRHPEFKGRTAVEVTDYQGTFVLGPEDVRSRLLTELGFEYPEALKDAFPNDFGGQLSDEKTPTLDVDALVWFADGDRSVAQLKRIPVYSGLGVRKQGRDVFILEDDRVYEATSFPSVLSMPLLMKELVPRLAAAVDGDPATSTDQRPTGDDPAATTTDDGQDS